MRVSNEPEGAKGPTGAFAELFRLQSDFQARLAEETVRYLRRMHGAVVPSAPGTVVVPAAGMELRAAAEPGGRAELSLEIENLQRVHCMVTPQLSPLVSASGVTWFPATESSAGSRLVAPSAVEQIALTLPIPADLAPGEYRGALLLQGFRSNALSVVVAVGRPAAPDAPKSARTAKAAPKKAVPAKAAPKKAARRKPARSRRSS